MKWTPSYYTNIETEYQGTFVVTDKVKRDDNDDGAPAGITDRACVFFFALKGNSPVKVATRGRKFVLQADYRCSDEMHCRMHAHIRAEVHTHMLHNVTRICEKRTE